MDYSQSIAGFSKKGSPQDMGYRFRVLSIVPQRVKAKVSDALCWISSQFWFGIVYCGIIVKTLKR
jgi:hypothetical protein